MNTFAQLNLTLTILAWFYIAMGALVVVAAKVLGRKVSEFPAHILIASVVWIVAGWLT